MQIWIAIAALTFTVVVAALSLAYRLGRLDQRVSDLETSREGLVGLTTEMARFDERQKAGNERLEAMSREMAGVHRQLANFATGKVKIIQPPEVS